MLRATLGFTAITHGFTYLSDERGRHFSVLASAIFDIICGAFLIIGFMTPISSFILLFCILASAASIVPAARFNLLEPKLSVIYICLTALALAVLGPGSFSLDSLMFGRREILIPGKTDPPKP